jgi:hypothetical protein
MLASIPAPILNHIGTNKGIPRFSQARNRYKLPVRVRPHTDWQDAVSSAAATRNMLEEKARREVEHLRPVALFQAQDRTGAVAVDVLRSYLEKEKLIPPSWIAVATGEQRELDGVNLADPGCPIRYVITVEALKEGWDCPSAYVFCSVARVSSLTAVEQLLGRVLRMPYAGGVGTARFRLGTRDTGCGANRSDGVFLAPGRAHLPGHVRHNVRHPAGSRRRAGRRRCFCSSFSETWLGRQDSNLGSRDQNPLPYRLATPHNAPCKGCEAGRQGAARWDDGLAGRPTSVVAALGARGLVRRLQRLRAGMVISESGPI